MEEKYFNRELSWIEFNGRVLHEACRRELPLMERLKFLSIVSTNFDEFFQVRVASIKRLQATSAHTEDMSGLSPSELLRRISTRSHQITHTQYSVLMSDVLPGLAKAGLAYIPPALYSPVHKSFLLNLFQREIFPLLTPLRTDGQDFPHIGNQFVHAAFLLDPIAGITTDDTPFSAKKGEPAVAIVQIPSAHDRIIWLPSNEPTRAFTMLDDCICQFGTQLFPGYTIKESMLFSVARDADFSVNEEAGTGFIEAMEEVVIRRQTSFAVRMVCNTTSPTVLKILMEKLSLEQNDVYQVDGMIHPEALLALTTTEAAADLSYPEWKNFYPASLDPSEPLWDTIQSHDLLLHVPYESFDPVIRFISDAADDPGVLAIKMTLYRTETNSRIVHALERAAHNGKQVTAFVELKARFDEQRNISWATQLEKAGVIVVYGIVNLKVHAKTMLVIRREGDSIRRYVHLSTGNYNSHTAELYSDLSIFTANTEIANDTTLFFNTISGYTALQTMKHLFMAPVTIKSQLLAMIEREIKLSTPETPGLIIAKMNSLGHHEIINALYRASRAGVRIQLNIRGVCQLIPGKHEMSETISVVSIIDRYLEHSRIAYFQNGGAEELYLTSADWMPRNLDRRIELMFPVTDRDVFTAVKETLLLYFTDNTHSYALQPDGTWKANAPERKELAVSAQEVLYRKYKKKTDTAKKEPRLEFTVRRH
jgi:polyphosphate kinase